MFYNNNNNNNENKYENKYELWQQRKFLKVVSLNYYRNKTLHKQ